LAIPRIRIEQVSKSFGPVQVIKDLSLEIARGEFVSLLGPSGSGKTTLLMLLAGFEQPSAGTILLDGQRIDQLPPHRRAMGVVFQNYALFPHMSVADNVAFPLKMRGMGRAETEAKVTRALDMVQLAAMRERRPAQLSGGQQQRVALARALVFEPAVVLMDEPLGALDKQLREHMQIELKDLHRQLGVTFVYVTHDQGEALTMSDRVAVFNEGFIQQLDAVERLYEAPANRFVAGFVGDNTVLKGQLSRGGEQAEMVLPDGRVLAGLNVNGASAGAAVEACIRPERVVLHRRSGAPGANMLAAEVARVIYFGDHMRLLCSLAGGQAEATVKLPLASLDGSATPQAGEAVLLEFPTAHARIYAL